MEIPERHLAILETPENCKVSLFSEKSQMSGFGLSVSRKSPDVFFLPKNFQGKTGYPCRHLNGTYGPMHSSGPR